MAQFERAIIKERQREGITKAQAKGKHCGRTSMLNPEQVKEIKARVDAGEEKKALALEYGVRGQSADALSGPPGRAV
nr:recombinase family protein [Paucidesulfovibrio longus]